MNDLVIRGGWLVDGLGGPRKRADIGIADGRVTEITEPGQCEGRAAVDADGLIVSPGFVDIHTHYDAQLKWDNAATPSSLHGVTSLIGGNCGFSLAPVTPESAEYLIPMLAVVEGMSEAALRSGLDVNWTSFGDYLDGLEGHLAVNAGFMVGHSAIRRTVMGKAAIGGKASDQELSDMTRLVHESIEAGALGLSTSKGSAHVDQNGDAVPSRHASLTEVMKLCEAVGQHPGTSLEAIPPTAGKKFTPESQLFLVAMSLAGGRPVNWNSLTIEANAEARADRLEASDAAKAVGGKVVVLARCQPQFGRNSLESPFLWETIPNWADVMRLPMPQRLAAFKDPDMRRKLKEGSDAVPRGQGNFLIDWATHRISDAQSPSLKQYVGKDVGEIAKERGVDPFDAFCDISVEGDLEVGWITRTVGDDDAGWRDLISLLRNPYVVVGASDAGAHLDMISSFSMYTGLLSNAVHQRQILSLEEAIALITSRTARLFGLLDRGVIQVGSVADIVIFDEDTIGQGPIELRHDLPASAARIFCESVGIHEVLVNGVATIRDGALTGATPGKTIRSGRDTQTPTMSYA